MTKTFDMQFMRYMNIFARGTGIIAKHCFSYNNTIVFVVPRPMIQKAIGQNNYNLKKLSEIIGKRIRILGQPTGMKDLQIFVSTLVSPIEFEKIEVINNPETRSSEAIITTGGRESKAMLIGRDRAREKELKDILEQYFEIKNVRIN